MVDNEGLPEGSYVKESSLGDPVGSTLNGSMLGACDGDLEGDPVGSVDKSSKLGASVGRFDCVEEGIFDGEDVGNLEGEFVTSGDGLKDDG